MIHTFAIESKFKRSTCRKAFEAFRQQQNTPEYYNDLSKQTKIDHITKIILGCSNTEAEAMLKELYVDDYLSQGSFYTLLREGFCLRQTITDIIALKDNTDLFSSEFIKEHYLTKFPKLLMVLLNQHAEELAMIYANKFSHKELNKAIRESHKFCAPRLSQALQEIMLVRNNLHTLASTTPSQMFLDTEFEPALFHKFKNYVEKQFPNDKKAFIADEILSVKENRAMIQQSLRNLQGLADNFFGGLAEQMQKSKEIKQQHQNFFKNAPPSSQKDGRSFMHYCSQF